MGLDITAYQVVTKLNVTSADETWEADGLWIDEEQPFNRLDGLETGAYAVSGDRYAFRAGSYSGYNEWRRMLARMVGVIDRELWNDHSEAAKATPFYELICFSDAEGTIGPKTCAKLAKDFDDWADRAKASGDRYWLEKYQDWSKAFHLAAERGVVDFH